MSREPGTVVLDARSREKYEALYIKGALNLSFPTSRSRAWRDCCPTNTQES